MDTDEASETPPVAKNAEGWEFLPELAASSKSPSEPLSDPVDAATPEPPVVATPTPVSETETQPGTGTPIGAVAEAAVPPLIQEPVTDPILAQVPVAVTASGLPEITMAPPSTEAPPAEHAPDAASDAVILEPEPLVAAEPEPVVAAAAVVAEAATAPPGEEAAATETRPTPTAEPLPPLTPPRLALAVQNLGKRFGTNRVLNGLSFHVGEGEIYGFLGKNGAGKTTTIRTLMGIIRPDEGHIELFGKRTRRPGIKQKRLIGYVSQDQHFYPWMTCEDLGKFASGFYPTWDRQEFARLLALLDLPPTRRFSQLSGGMKLKLALAMALAYRPPLLILDEPTAGLDPVARREFLDIIESQARNYGRTTFFSTHRIDEVERLADRVGIVHEGRMFYEGTVPALKESVRKVVVSLETRAPAVEASSPPTPLEGIEPGEQARSEPIPGLFAPPPVPKPPVFIGEPYRLLREERYSGEWVRYYWAPPGAWENHPFPPEASVQEIGLEEIVLAFVGSQRVEL